MRSDIPKPRLPASLMVIGASASHLTEHGSDGQDAYGPAVSQQRESRWTAEAPFASAARL